MVSAVAVRGEWCCDLCWAKPTCVFSVCAIVHYWRLPEVKGSQHWSIRDVSVLTRFAYSFTDC